MRNVREAIIHLIGQVIDWMNRKKAMILPLAMIVTVVTVYSLVMPAFTLEKEEAEKQGGIDVPGVEQLNEEQSSEEEPASEEGQAAIEEKASEEDKVPEGKTSQESEQASNEKQLITKETELTKKGKGYSVSVTVDKKAAVPEDTELAVNEIKDEEDKDDKDSELPDYDELYKKAKKALQKKIGKTDIKTIKFYDISLVSGDEEVEPSSDVDVKIKSNSIKTDSDDKDYHIIHFGEGEPEVLDSEAKDGEISFTTDGFSVYAVIEDSTSENARMKLEFYSKGRLLTTVYVKNSDELLGDGVRDPQKQYVEDIIHDPGIGALASGEIFAGWILDKQNYTTEDLDDTKNIEDIWEWAVNKSIAEGETHRFDAAICKMYNVTYKDYDDEETGEIGTVLGRDAILVASTEHGTYVSNYKVKMGYTPKDDIHNFEGWELDPSSDSHVTSTIPSDRIYQNDSYISINGDISFTVNAPIGAWLIFDENGKGGKYNAPQFVKSGETTSEPCSAAEMIRNGYTFGGWYDTKEHADAHGADPSVTTGRFTFGGEITEKTTVYASWIPNTRAPYTIILWTQNQNRTGYDLKDSYVGTGNVGSNIPYTFNDNGAEDYITGLGNNQIDDDTYGIGHYKGFCAIRPQSQVVIRPEGDSVLNIYFDRIEYDVRFYVYRYRNQAGDNDYEYPQNSANGNNVWGVVNFHDRTTLANMPRVDAPLSIQSDTVDGYTSYYFVLHGYYGEDISEKWPKYTQIHLSHNNREAVSYVMMVGTRMKPRPSSGGDGTVKGIVTTLDDGILGATNDSDGNFLIVRFNTYNDWTYHLYYEPYEGQDLTGKTTRVFQGKTYYLDHDVTARSSNTIPGSQNAPEYQGFQTVRGADNKALYDGTAPTTGPGAIPQQNGVSGYHPYLNYYYDRLEFPINYMDGTYFDGDGNIIQNRQEEPINTSDDIAYQQPIPEKWAEYEPDEQDEFVFAGWYADAGCTTKYNFDTTMPLGGVIVYAKWVQKQYRVFLHPMAGTDPSLDWGSESQSTCFRISYDDTISTPTGTRANSGYAFVGWYTDPSRESQYLYNADTKLNDDTVTTAYDQTDETELDKWGNVKEGEEGYNADKNKGRFWITRKLDLYAKWRKILDGEGINVVYDPDDGKGHKGSDEPVDEAIYPDQAQATGQAACTPPSTPAGTYFRYWVIQKWDADAQEYVDTDEKVVMPGDKFTVDEEYAKKEADPDNPGKYKYTFKLRAEYAEPNQRVQTHIWWFDNYSDTGAERHNSSRQDEDIEINKTISIKDAPTRDGYQFLGWARIPTGTSESEAGNPPTGLVLDLTEDDVYLKYDESVAGKYVLNDSSSEDNGKPVIGVAADEKLAYHDMYAVWEKIYKVKVKKIVVSGMNPDKQKNFTFTPGGALGTTQFTLKDGQETGDYSVRKNQNISVEETADDDFNTEITVTDYKGNPVTSDKIHIDGNKITVDQVKDDMIITYTNTRKGYDVEFVKVDDNNSPLAGASFTLAYKNTEGGTYSKVTDFVIGEEQVKLIAGYYELTEVDAPDGYVIMQDKTHFQVKADGTITGNDNDHVTITPATGTIKYIIKIENEAGDELPITGGIGTTILYVAGAILSMISGILMVIRAKQKLN